MWPAQEKNKTCKLELLDFQFIIPIKVVMQWNTWDGVLVLQCWLKVAE